MVKIVRIISRLNIGGPAIHTVLLSESLNRGGYKDILVCGSAGESEGDMSYLAREKGVRPIIVAEMHRDISLWSDLKAFFKIYLILKREKPDIVHTHTAKAGTLGRLAAILAGVPIKIHTLHGHVLEGYFNPLKAKIFLFIEKFLALFTDRIITVSQRVKDDIVNRLKVTNGRKCVVIPLGFELDKFLECEKQKGVFRKELALDDETTLIGIVGRLVPIKNHRMFLNAAKIIKENAGKYKVKFLIIGDGELRSELEAQARALDLAGDVIFTGWVKDLVSVYADLNIVTLTSLNEGTPVSLIEASASAKPVVSTAVGGVKDIVINNRTGFLVKSDDTGEFTEKLSELLANRDKAAELGSNGRAFVRNIFSKERLVKDIEDLYEECLKGKRRI